MTIALTSLDQAASRIAEAFIGRPRCQVFVQEQRAFKGKWLCLGDISLPLKDSKEDEQPDAALATAAFEWQLPNLDVAESDLASLLEVKMDNNYTKIGRALDQTASIAVRAGLLNPTFDPAAIEEMPFHHATTIVSDTSGILQGALDFIVRNLHPAARVKIPAIVQMEIVNSTDRFFSIRRSNETSSKRNGRKLFRMDELIEHLKSQGGQRTLLRLELQSDAEVERTYLLGDPLRSAFQPEKGSGLNSLNISVPVSAYVDRLILEAARHHQAQSEPGHAVRLLTSDQGLARMALAEGMMPLYFTAVKSLDFFGIRLTGQTFNPFTGEVHSVSLAKVLWELATAFGIARLQWDGGGSVTVSALSEDTSWSPFHSVDDLLWFSVENFTNGTATGTPLDAMDAGLRRKGAAQGAPAVPGDVSRQVPQSVSFQQMSIDRLLKLICALDDRQALDISEVATLLNVRKRSASEYRRFLVSAGLLQMEGNQWKATPAVRLLSAELRNNNASALCKALLQAPSFAAFQAHVAQSPIGQVVEMSSLSRRATTYRTLGELTLICASVGSDVYATPARPNPAPFVKSALHWFRELDNGNGLVSTGRWLESLIQHEGIHPETARRALEKANENGLLRCIAEGSTMQTAFDKHIVHVLRMDADGLPIATPVHLYRGDYLIPGKASVSLRIEEQS